MSLDNNVIKLIGILTLSIPGTAGMNFYRHHDVNYDTGTKKVMEKADGPLSHTCIEIDKSSGEIVVTRSSLLRYKSITESDGEGHIDKVYFRQNPFARGSHSRTYYSEDLASNPELRANANIEYQEQLQRFEHLMNK